MGRTRPQAAPGCGQAREGCCVTRPGTRSPGQRCSHRSGPVGGGDADTSVLWTPRLCDQQPHELPGALGGDSVGDPGLQVCSTQVAGQALGRVLPTHGSI